MITSNAIADALAKEILEESQTWDNASHDQLIKKEIVEGYLSWAVNVELLTSCEQLSDVIKNTMERGWV